MADSRLASLAENFVEETQISAAHPLADGDIIRFGGTRVAFRRSDTLTVPTIDLDDATPRGRKGPRKKR